MAILESDMYLLENAGGHMHQNQPGICVSWVPEPRLRGPLLMLTWLLYDLRCNPHLQKVTRLKISGSGASHFCVCLNFWRMARPLTALRVPVVDDLS